MTSQSESGGCKNGHQNFCEYFQPKTSLNFVFGLSTIISLIDVMLSYGIIRYEKSQIDHRKTLLDKLRLFFFRMTIVAAPIIHSLNFLNYYFGPLNYSVCFFLMVFRNILKSNMLFFFNCIAIARYIFIFWVKNPTSIDENFWAQLIATLSIIFSCILNTVAYILPQRHSIFLYTCADIDPTPHLMKEKVRVFQLEVLATAVIQLFVFSRIKFFKLKCKIPPESVGKNSSFNSKSFYAAFYVIGWFSLYSYLQLKINSFSPQEVNNYPNYVFMYLYQLVAAEILRLIIIITHYIVNNKLREKTSIFLRNLMSNIVNSVNNFVQKDVYSCNL